MKSCHFWNVDILKIIKVIWTVTLHFMFQLQTRLEQQNRSPSPATRAQLLHVHFVLFAVYQNVKTLFSKTNMPVYAWKIFLENAIEMVSIIPSSRASEAMTFRNPRHLANSHRTQWKHLVVISERLLCIHVWRTRFSVVPIHRTVHQKNESWTDGNSVQKDPDVLLC